jgi:hypothetical protein
MDEYKSNSFKKREDEPPAKVKVMPVCNGTIKKKTGFGKLVSTFFSEDIGDVKKYIIQDILVPSIKMTLVEIISGSAEMSLLGSNGRFKKGGYTPYASQYAKSKTSSDTKPVSMNAFDYDTITVDNRGEAERVLDSMEEAIAEYGMVTVGDLYDLCNISRPGQSTDNKYGWKNLRNAKVIRHSNGYYSFDLPKALPIN